MTPRHSTATAAAGPSAPPAPARLLFLSTDLDSFFSHKRPLAEAAVRAGYDVTVAGFRPPSFHLPPSLDFKLVEIEWRRAPTLAGALLRVVPDFFRVRALFRRLRPDLIHNIDLKPSIVGSLASAGLGARLINAVNGLGFAFTDDSFAARTVQWACGVVLRRAVRRSGAVVVVQNKDDAALLHSRLRLPVPSIRIIRGSGVDPAAFDAAPPDAGAPANFLILSRLLRIKGIHIAVEALGKVRDQGIAATLTIAGAPDPGNPSSYDAATAAQWAARPGVVLVGHAADVRPLIAGSRAVVQPSLGGEGLPKSLLEAAAGGRALIATDVPGNREIVVPGENRPVGAAR